MAVSFVKGQGANLAPSLSEVFVGLGWDTKSTDSDFDFDLDACAFLLGANDKLISESHFIFYNNLISPDPDESVQHLVDNDSGMGEGDDEIIKVNLKKVPAEVKKIVFTVTIYDAEARKQNFGQVKNAFARLVNAKTNEEVIRYNLVEGYSVETAIIMAELYRQDGGWNLKAVGSAYKNGIQGLFDLYRPVPEDNKVSPAGGLNWRYQLAHQSR